MKGKIKINPNSFLFLWLLMGVVLVAEFVVFNIQTDVSVFPLNNYLGAFYRWLVTGWAGF